jgi:cell division protein ZapE
MTSDRLDTLNSVSEAYLQRVEEGSVRYDPMQAVIAARLDNVLAEINAKRLAEKRRALGWLFARRVHKVNGLYIHGAVGRGKTMLMDLFHERVPGERKRRVHFNDFMVEVHDRIAAQRQADRNGARNGDPIRPVAAAIAAETAVLCFDEFAVTDIADAMILSRLFTALFDAGVILVATSNVAPRDLYRDGLNRGLFLPFIKVLEAHAEIVTLDTDRDYRLEKAEVLPVYLSPLDADAALAIERSWAGLTRTTPERREWIEVAGRKIEVPRSAGRAARFTFAEICERPLGARDYLALAERYDVFVVENVPVMDEASRNAAKRFILLVDTLYDRRCRLILSAEATADALHVGKSGKEAFEFERTASRLAEMQRAGWPGSTSTNTPEFSDAAS